MRKNSKISVIISAYNEEKYIKDCLDSLFNQSYNNFEIIIVNDGSTDNTENIVLDYCKKYKNLIYIPSQNKGQGYSRNLAMDYVTGEYIYIMDADDTIEPHTFKLCIDKMNINNYDFVFFEWKKDIDATKQVKYTFFNNDIGHLDELIGEDCYLLLKIPAYYTVNKLYRYDFIKKNNIKYGEGYIYEDHIFYIKTCIYAKKIGLIHSPLYNYRIHNKSTTKSNLDTNKHVEGVLKATSEKFKLNIKSTDALQYIINHSVNSFVWCYKNKTPLRYKENFIKEYLKMMKSIKLDSFDKLNSIATKIYKFDIKNNELKKLLKNNYKTEIKKIRKKFIRKCKRILMYLIDKVIPVNKNLILFMGFDNNYIGNSKQLFEQMLEEYPQYKYYFVTQDNSVPQENRIKNKSLKFYYCFFTAKIVFFETWYISKMKKRKNQIWIQLWHATTIKKILFDSAEKYSTINNPKHRINKFNFIKDWDYLITDTPNINKFFETAFLIDKNKIKPYGYPRVKFLIDNRDNEQLKNKIKSILNIDNEKKTILYVPTWRDYNYEKNNQDYSYLIDFQKLLDLTNNKYNIIFKDHPYMNSFKNKNSNIINGMNIETQELLLIADIIISDYSSIVFDAMAINIPIIIYAKDYIKYENARGIYKEVFNDLLHWKADTEEDIINLIRSYKIDKKYLNIKNKYCFDVNNYKTLEFINDLLTGNIPPQNKE